jgi:hypothetical protein
LSSKTKYSTEKSSVEVYAQNWTSICAGEVSLLEVALSKAV